MLGFKEWIKKSRKAWKKKCHDNFFNIDNRIAWFSFCDKRADLGNTKLHHELHLDKITLWQALNWSTCCKQVSVGTATLGATATTTIQGLGHINLTPTVAETEPRHQKGDEGGPWTWGCEGCPGDGWEPKGVWLEDTGVTHLGGGVSWRARGLRGRDWRGLSQYHGPLRALWGKNQSN